MACISLLNQLRYQLHNNLFNIGLYMKHIGFIIILHIVVIIIIIIIIIIITIIVSVIIVTIIFNLTTPFFKCSASEHFF